MSTRYKKNKHGIYKIPLYRRLSVYLIILVALTLATSGINALLNLFEINLKYLEITELTLIIFTICISLIPFSSFIVSVYKNKSVRKYLRVKKIEKEVKKVLLSSMSVNTLKDSPHFIDVPAVKVDIEEDFIAINIEKLANMYSVEKLGENVNVALKDKYKNYAITESRLSENRKYFEFLAEDVATDKSFTPLRNEHFQREDNFTITLQKGTVLDVSQGGSMGIFGATGSRKSTTARAFIQCGLAKGWEFYFSDNKPGDLGLFNVFYPSLKVATSTDIDRTFHLLREATKKIAERTKITEQYAKEWDKSGANGRDLNFRPLVVVIDELGSLIRRVSSDKTKAKELEQLLTEIVEVGRSSNVMLWLIAQDPSTKSVPEAIRRNLLTRVLCGVSKDVDQTMVFGKSVDISPRKGQGIFITDMMKEPKLFYVPNLIKGQYLDLKRQKEVYKIGVMKVDEYRQE